MFILKILEGKFLREKGQQEVCKECCSRAVKSWQARMGSVCSLAMLCSRMMNWLMLTLGQHHHSCCKGQRIHDFPKASRGIKSQWKLVLGCFCAHILLKHRGNLIGTGI